MFSDNRDSHLDYLRLVLQFLDQFSHGLDLDAGAASSRCFDFQGLHGGRGGDAQRIRVSTSSGFFLAFMMFGSDA